MGTRVTLSSRLPSIARGMVDGSAAQVQETGARVKAEALARVPRGHHIDNLHDNIEIVQTGPFSLEVRAGSRRVFYAHLVEFGTIRVGPRPFMTPAGEVEREPFKRGIAKALNG